MTNKTNQFNVTGWNTKLNVIHYSFKTCVSINENEGTFKCDKETHIL